MRKLLILFIILFAFSAMPVNTFAHPNYQATGNDCAKPVSSKKYVIKVAAATLWSSPGAPRLIDKPAVSSPAQLRQWTKSMTLSQKLQLVGKADTQALYGQEVTVLKSKGDWYYVAVKDQATPRNKNGYPGWVPKAQIAETRTDFTACSIAVIKRPTAYLYRTPGGKKEMEISFDTRLPVVKSEKNWIQIRTPDDSLKWLRQQDAAVYKNAAAIPEPKAQEVIATARMFTGLAYLWGGTSGFGFDCSGFVSAVYRHHGIMIPRDSSAQFTEGKAVSWKYMKPGDLMYFAHNRGKGKVHHVAMYIGNGRMIHSPESGKAVEVISVETRSYKNEFAGARRFLQP